MGAKQSSLKSISRTAVLPTRAQPLRRLSKHSRDLWRSIASEYPAGHFAGANLPLLEAFVRSADEVLQYDTIVYAEGLFVDGAPHPAVSVRRATVLQMASLAVKLRLSISSTLRADAKDARRDPEQALRKPWAA